LNFQIKNKWSGNVLFEIEAGSLKLAIELAIKSRADLSRADLSGADLSGADLYGANGVDPYRSTPLLMLFEQPGLIRSYKLVTSELAGPYYNELIYKIGSILEVDDADIDPTTHCGKGISVATLDWCIRDYQEGYRIMIVEFKSKDIACIPTATDGKFRLHRCKVVAEKDLTEIGLVEKETEAI